jgi:transcriptional regulator with XRE-family HTH domain
MDTLRLHWDTCKPIGVFLFPIGDISLYRGVVANREASDYSKRLADVIVGEYKKRRLTQRELVEALGYKRVTLQRMLSGISEISAEDVIRIATFVGFDASKVLDEALDLVGGLPALTPPDAEMSHPHGHNDLEVKRKQREALAMTPEQREGERIAAIDDAELSRPEPDQP